MRTLTFRSIKPIAVLFLMISAMFVVAPANAQSENPNQDVLDEQTAEEIAEAALIKAAIDIMVENIKASGRESGEIDKLIRALSGVSVKDIKAYGICGGPNSEVRKLFGSMCKPI